MPGEELTDIGEGITLCHESFGNRSDPPALLIMGLGTQMIAWREDFCEQLASRGFHVIRFDNRDCGHSTHLSGPPPSLPQLITRKLPDDAYSLEDMAHDAARLSETLGLGPTHVVGASMGGMIGQVMAARHPGDVSSLVSIMSNTGSRWTGQPALSAYRYFLAEAPEERDAFVEHIMRLFRVVGSREDMFDEEYVRDVTARSFDRDHDSVAVGRQLGAVLKTGNRGAALRSIKAPTLVIHGTEDKLVRPSGGRATAKAIPGARLLEVDGMGHDLPRAAWPQIIDAIAENAARAGAESRRALAA
ncbi:MAG: alpha/beta fold hydrolase [Actinomycetota bacterium]|nr:alpha/beta fold hydrolase [Actinomycetota bacterium]